MDNFDADTFLYAVAVQEVGVHGGGGSVAAVAGVECGRPRGEDGVGPGSDGALWAP